MIKQLIISTDKVIYLHIYPNLNMTVTLYIKCEADIDKLVKNTKYIAENELSMRNARFDDREKYGYYYTCNYKLYKYDKKVDIVEKILKQNGICFHFEYDSFGLNPTLKENKIYLKEVVDSVNTVDFSFYNGYKNIFQTFLMFNYIADAMGNQIFKSDKVEKDNGKVRLSFLYNGELKTSIVYYLKDCTFKLFDYNVEINGNEHNVVLKKKNNSMILHRVDLDILDDILYDKAHKIDLNNNKWNFCIIKDELSDELENKLGISKKQFDLHTIYDEISDSERLEDNYNFKYYYNFMSRGQVAYFEYVLKENDFDKYLSQDYKLTVTNEQLNVMKNLVAKSILLKNVKQKLFVFINDRLEVVDFKLVDEEVRW